MPRGASAGLEAYAEGAQARWVCADDDFVEPDGSGEIIRRTFAAGAVFAGQNFHFDSPFGCADSSYDFTESKFLWRSEEVGRSCLFWFS